MKNLFQNPKVLSSLLKIVSNPFFGFINDKFDLYIRDSSGMNILGVNHRIGCGVSVHSEAMSDPQYVRVRIIKAKDLLSVNRTGMGTGTCDPYLVLSLGNETKKTTHLKKDSNPVWNQAFDLLVSNPNDILKVSIMDKNRITSDKFLGRVDISLADVANEDEFVCWYDLKDTAKGQVQIGLTGINFGKEKQSIRMQSAPDVPVQPSATHSSGITVTACPPGCTQSFSVANDNLPGYLKQNVPAYARSPSPTPHAPHTPHTASAPPPQSTTSGSTRELLSSSATREGYDLQYEEINFDKKIGVGACGEVWKGEWAGTSVAIKKILKTNIEESDVEEFSTEILLMSKLRHPNIVQFLGACFDPEFCLVTELMDRGSLFDVVAREQLSWLRKVDMCLDVARGMMYLHSRNPPIIHRDIKSLNILVTKDWKCTISDFGLTRIKDRAMLNTQCGSPAWSAPEVLRGEPYDEKADVYSYSVVVWEILSQDKPYKGLNPHQVIGLVAYKNPGGRPSPIPACPYPELIQLMTQGWDDAPNKRPFFPEINKRLKEIKQRIEASS